MSPAATVRPQPARPTTTPTRACRAGLGCREREELPERRAAREQPPGEEEDGQELLQREDRGEAEARGVDRPAERERGEDRRRGERDAERDERLRPAAARLGNASFRNAPFRAATTTIAATIGRATPSRRSVVDEPHAGLSVPEAGATRRSVRGDDGSEGGVHPAGGRV